MLGGGAGGKTFEDIVEGYPVGGETFEPSGISELFVERRGSREALNGGEEICASGVSEGISVDVVVAAAPRATGDELHGSPTSFDSRATSLLRRVFSAWACSRHFSNASYEGDFTEGAPARPLFRF